MTFVRSFSFQQLKCMAFFYRQLCHKHTELEYSIRFILRSNIGNSCRICGVELIVACYWCVFRVVVFGGMRWCMLFIWTYWKLIGVNILTDMHTTDVQWQFIYYCSYSHKKPRWIRIIYIDRTSKNKCGNSKTIFPQKYDMRNFTSPQEQTYIRCHSTNAYHLNRCMLS